MNMKINFENNTLKRNKGNSLLDFPDNYTIVDLETTGLDPYYDEIIEISGLKVKNNKITKTFSSLIKPKRKIDEFITELTGITNEMVANSPSINEIITDFIEFIEDDIIVGHNVNFDINFLYDNYMKVTNKELKNDYIDTMRLARNLLKDLRHHRLKDLINYYKIEATSFHRALSDCNSTFSIYKCIKNDVIVQYNTIENFIIELKKRQEGVKAKDITTTNKNFDSDNILYNKSCVFTGKLEKMDRRQAMQKVVDLGGLVQDNINKETNFLIIGSFDYCSNIKGNKSNKIKKAELMKANGRDIEILSENIFYDIINIT